MLRAPPATHYSLQVLSSLLPAGAGSEAFRHVWATQLLPAVRGLSHEPWQQQRLQPQCSSGCNPVQQWLQPYAVAAATRTPRADNLRLQPLGHRGCNAAYR